MIAILAGILAIIFSTTRIYLTMRERRDSDRARSIEQRLRLLSQERNMGTEGNNLMDEKELIYYRLKAYAKTKRMALFMSILLLVVSATFLAITIANR